MHFQNGHQGVLDLQIARCALQLGRVHEARGREAVDREVRGWGDASAVLQGRDPLAQGVEIGDEGVPRVRLALGPAVAGDLEGAAVAQDGLGGEGGLAQEASNHPRYELLLHHREDAVALREGLPDEVAGVQGAQVGGGEVARVAFALRVAVAGDLEGAAVAKDAGPGERRLEQQVLDDRREELVLHDLMNGAAGGAGRAHEVAGVPRRLVQEARPGDLGVHLDGGVVVKQRYVDLVDDRGLELRPAHVDAHQPGDGVGDLLVRLGRGVVGREVRAARHGVGDGLVGFGPRVEVQQGRDDLVVDLAGIVVARQRRGDGRAHLAAGLVVRQLAGHEARHLALVLVGHQLASDEGQHLGLRPVLGQIQRVEGRRDGSSGPAACRSRCGRMSPIR